MFLALGVCACLAVPSGQAQEVRAFVDEIRKQHGLVAVRANSTLEAAAQSHLDYMVANNTISHNQIPGKASFSARTPGERTKLFGYVGRNSEALSYSSRGLREALNGLFIAPYHRVMFLQPSRPDFGAAATEGTVVVKFGGETGSGIVASPPNGARDVTTTWDAIETPDPLRAAHVDGPTGFPIVIAFFGTEAAGLRFVSASLTNNDGKELPVVTLHPGNDRSSESAIILIPQRPLAPGTRYRYSVTYANRARRDAVTGTFATAK